VLQCISNLHHFRKHIRTNWIGAFHPMISKKKTIAVLIPHLNQYYQRDLWYAILKEADNMGYNTLFFCGGVLKSPLRDERESNIIYNLCSLDQVDGIISVSGTLSNYAGIEVFEDFINRLVKNHL
jgi:DNA-binding LacI/PurR family transcriptional regulator